MPDSGVGAEDGATSEKSGGSGSQNGFAGSTKDSAEKTGTPQGGGTSAETGATDVPAAGEERPDPTAGATRPAPSTTTPREIALPALELDALSQDEALVRDSARFTGVAGNPVSGTWEQVEGPTDSDFGPGGYSASVIAINPKSKTISVYRQFRGSIELVVGGELAIDVLIDEQRRGSGTIRIRQDPSLKSRFRDRPLPLGGAQQPAVLPPLGEGPWDLLWRREGPSLWVGNKRYMPTTRDDFESARRGGGDLGENAGLPDRQRRPRGNDGGRGTHETAFFGLRGGGKRVCFVVDISASMSENNKLDRMKTELTKSIEGFKPEQLFSVVFFSEDAHVIHQDWMKAGPDRARAIDLIQRQDVASGTNPTEALKFAFETLNPTPDCIFFMTDGEVPAGLQIIELIRQLNGGPTPTRINTVNFGMGASEQFMKDIASENRGDYVFVPL